MKLDTTIGKIKLKNPVLVASGTFGYGQEFAPFFNLRKLGGIVTKTVTLNPRIGNPPPRIVETPSGMVNAIGLQNPGASVFAKEKMPYLKKLGIPIIVSIMGHSPEELEAVTALLDKVPGVAGFEVNLSCPNVSYGPVKMFAHDPALTKKAIGAVRKKTRKTLIGKLSPDVSDIAEMAEAAKSAGADAVALINTLGAMVINPKTRRPVLGNKTGGLSGPCVRPVAVRLVYEVCSKIKLPVVGIGGIVTADDALQFLIAGAAAVQVGTAHFANPRASLEVLEGLQGFMKKEKINDVQELIGSVQA